MLDDTTDAPQPAAAPDKDRKTKEMPTGAAASLSPAPARLPFVLNFQLPQADPNPLLSLSAATFVPLPSGEGAVQQPTADTKAGQPALPLRRAAAASTDALPSLPAPQSDAQPVAALGIQLTAPLPDLPVAPVPTPSAPPAAASNTAHAPVETPVRIAPDRAAPPATLSPWKQTAEKLPNAELAFAARIVPAPAAKDRANSSEADASTAHAALPPAKTQAPDRQTNSGQEQQQQPEPKPEPAAMTQRGAVPASERETSPETDTGIHAALSLKPIAAPTVLTPVAIAPDSASPARAPDAPQHTPQAAEAHLPDPPAAAPAPPIRDFSLRLTGQDQDKVEVKVVETAGEIRVAVHSADPELTSSLQQGIGDLVGKLESHAMHAETWRPAGESTASAPTARSENSQNNQQPFSGDGSQDRQSRQQQTLQQRRRNKPDWLQEIDGTFDALHSDIVRRTA
jgi:hypothetical protein